MSERKTKKQTIRSAALSRMEKLHPVKTFMFFSLLGSTLVFLSMIFLYAIRVNELNTPAPFEFPKVFVVSTITLLLSSFSISKSLQAYKDDAVKMLQIYLLITTALALIFTTFQVAGWLQLFDAGLFIYAKSSVTFLYIITAFHLFHVLLGFFGLVYLNYKVAGVSEDLVRKLLFLSDKREKTKIELMTIFWHYINFLWLCLFFMFLFTL